MRIVFYLSFGQRYGFWSGLWRAIDALAEEVRHYCGIPVVLRIIGFTRFDLDFVETCKSLLDRKLLVVEYGWIDRLFG